jgi:AcrR family transcriptional regulator
MMRDEGAGRLERRKAETRRKLVDAARLLLADGRSQGASIQEITEAADVGFGSFYNHFASKGELFETAVLDVLEEIAEALDRLGDGQEDPVERFARSIRLAARFIRARPELARIVVGHGLEHLDDDPGVLFRARRDIEEAIAAGLFRVTSARLATAGTVGALLATLQVSLTHPSEVDDASCDELVENLLLMFGIPSRRARELATRPLPELVPSAS